MNGVIFTEVLYFFCQPAVCDLRLGHTDTVDFFRTCADRKGCYRKKGRFCLFAGMDCSIRIKREGQLFCFLRNLCPASGDQLQTCNSGFFRCLKDLFRLFFICNFLNDFCGSFSLSSMEAESKRFKMDLNSIRFINLKLPVYKDCRSEPLHRKMGWDR